MKRGRVRNLKVACLCGLAAGLLGLYGAWVGHIHAVFSEHPFVLSPWPLWNLILQLNEQGSWSVKDEGENVTGAVLWIVWIAEALMVIGPAALIPVVRGAGGLACDWRGAPARPGGQIVCASSQPLLDQALISLRRSAA